mmetsp:Transcript_27120/g.71335  ORF Transcript_27120/g.71335 Transcript_27120/m.71335 type:complete len:261 (+) Transcript_27120:580-1362(+)
MSRCLATEKRCKVLIVHKHRKLLQATARVLHALVVVPDVESRDLLSGTQAQIYHVLVRLRHQRSKPHVGVVGGATDTVEQLVNRARVVCDTFQVVQITRRCPEVIWAQWDGSEGRVQHLQSCQANVKAISPRGVQHQRDGGANDATRTQLPASLCHGTAVLTRTAVCRVWPLDPARVDRVQIVEGKMGRQPVVFFDGVKDRCILGEQDVFCLVGCQQARSLPDFAKKNGRVVEKNLHVSHAAGAVPPGLVVVPDPDHGEL